MRVLTPLLLAASLAGCAAVANERTQAAGQGHPMTMHGHAGHPSGMGGPGGTGPMMQHMQNMDANRDGMVSKQEFMKAHEAMFDAMKKNERGEVAMSSMAMCPMMAPPGGGSSTAPAPRR